MIRHLTVVLPLALGLATPALADIRFLGDITVAGNATDLSGAAPAFGGNLLSFGSDLWYDKASNSFWGNTDRGPGGGVIDFAPRIHQFSLGIGADGAVGGFTLQKTVVFTKNGQPFTGLNPQLATQADKGVLGLSFDPEGVAIRANGHFLVSDEYGPSIYEFDAQGRYVRSFTTPSNLVPREAGGQTNYVDGRGTITSGRQDNRGFEGLTLSRDGKTAYAILQDPLVNEGAQGDGRRGSNVRLVAFDVASGEATAQYVYQLEPRADINDRVPDDTFGATAQGRNIGVSSILALGDGKFLILERDNRGLGVDDPNAQKPVGSKRAYLIDITGATDVSAISLAGSNDLPEGVVPVSKTLWFDIAASLADAGIVIPEKLEGLAFGPAIDGGLSLVVVTDNDFSVTQSGAGEQFSVCTSGAGGISSQVALGVACPDGQSLIPSHALVFHVSGADLAAVTVPEPASWALMIGGFGLVGAALRRRARSLA